jgi:hypothetical protein
MNANERIKNAYRETCVIMIRWFCRDIIGRHQAIKLRASIEVLRWEEFEKELTDMVLDLFEDKTTRKEAVKLDPSECVTEPKQ